MSYFHNIGLGIVGLLLVAGLVCTSTPMAVAKTSIDPHSRVSSRGEILPPAGISPETVILPVNNRSIRDKDRALHSIRGITLESSVGDVTLLSPGYAGPNSDEIPPSILHIIDNDGRTQANTTTWPAQAVVHITGDGINGCSGFLYDDDTVATAAHCIHNGGRWVANLRIYPGRNLPSEPYGSCGAIASYTVQGWISTGFPDYDYGAIKLNCTIGNRTGWFGLKSELGVNSYNNGYPGDKPWGTQWKGVAKAYKWSEPIISITNDIKGGSSGSPVYDYFSGCGPCSFGIVSKESGFGPPTNLATGISPTILNNLVSWK